MPAAVHAVVGIDFIRVDVRAQHVVLYEALQGVPVRAAVSLGGNLSGGAAYQAPHNRLARGTALGTLVVSLPPK